MAEDDQDLLDRARSGQADALEKLLERHQAQIYRFGMKMCRDPEDAKDVLQDTLLSVARNVRDFRGSSSISTWLYSVARSFCLKKRRRSKFAPKELASPLDGAAEHVADPARGADETMASKQVEQALEAAIGALEPMYREVLLLRDVEGLTAPEVARVTGVSVQAVKSRLHRARLSVRAHIAPLLGIPTDLPAAAGTCPDVLALFSSHLEGEISPEICAEMEKHIETCPRCKGACDSLKRSLSLCHAAAIAPQIPANVQASVKVALRDFLSATP
ncbi:MAG TPA: sigma-70 family RNA polymerase sigma factor [Polyangiaceae bacterium]|jgi:RNA polymerase sigma-70 factor (ECF subfamily)